MQRINPSLDPRSDRRPRASVDFLRSSAWNLWFDSSSRLLKDWNATICKGKKSVMLMTTRFPLLILIHSPFSIVASYIYSTYNNAWKKRKPKTVRLFRLVKLSFDNFDRTLKIEQLADCQFASEPGRRTTVQVSQDLTSVSLQVVATKPSGSPLLRQRCDLCIVIGVPVIDRQGRAWEPTIWWQIRQGVP